MRISVPTHRLAAAAAIGSGALCLLAGANSASAAFPGQNGVIVAAKCGNGHGCADGALNNLVAVDPASGAETPITNDLSYLDDDPTVSPDGSRVVFTRWAGATAHLAAVGIGGGTVKDLTAGPDDYYPAFSPDGSKIVFSRYSGGGEHLIVMDATGGNEHPLTSGTAFDRSPAWSPDGSSIVFERQVAGVGYQIYRVPASGGTPVALGSGVADRYPNFSPDGSHVVFSRLTGPNTMAVWTMDAGGGNEHPLTTPAANTQDDIPAFSPDGTQIVFERNSGSPANTSVLMAMNADGSNQHLVSAAGDYLYKPDWQPLPAAASGAPASGPAPQADTTGPRLTLRAPKLESIRKGRLYVFATVSERATGVGRGNVTIPKLAKSYRLGLTSRTLSANTRTRLWLPLPKRTLRAARAALTHHNRIRATLTVRVEDGAGNTASQRLKVRLAK